MQHSSKKKDNEVSFKQPAAAQPPTKYTLAFVRYSLQTLWLLTVSDIGTFVVPGTAFGMFGALAGPLLTTSDSPDLFEILGRLPLVFLWNFAYLCIFTLANQRLPESVLEDSLNKPWRPLPSGRLTIIGTRRILLAALPVVLTINYLLGAWEETALLFCLTWMYNDLKGGDEDFILRNLIISGAFFLYNKGSLKVASGPNYNTPLPRTWLWLSIVSGVIFTTMHVQDMADQEGDGAKGRRSAPIVLGDRTARWTVAIPTAIWAVVCPLFWRMGPVGYIVPVGLGFYIVGRELWLQNPVADKKTWHYWCLWTACLYVLPLAKDPRAFSLFLKAHSI
ncbi:Fumagillin beta-trans-bergamotene synthase [Lachnellula arida]|uniref:Fumagillin beta-trans-bergamotene synthase n=1 Tax=Lachnellula arida TaxID=1316785 RepID=A0A8T9B6D0_9HELO|nr:Fumagillin beta-trans-bergamotene synthase [Lachnellula arida]